MNKKEIEDRIAELDAIIAEDDKVSAENNRRIIESDSNLESELKAHLKDAGFPVDEFTNVDCRTYLLGMGEKLTKVNVTFKHGRDNINITFNNRKVSSFDTDASRYCELHGESDDGLIKLESFYKKVTCILDKLNSKWFSTDMCLFFETLENYVSPELLESDFTGNAKEEKNKLETELKALSLELEVGKEIEFYYDSKKRYGSRWVHGTVEKITDKTVYVYSPALGRKAINRCDVANSIRNVTAA